MYLAAAGVGRLGIVDFDVVDYSNLQRQVIHGTPDVGRPKLESARDTLRAINPEVHIETHEVALSSANALDVLGGYDVIVDGTDNFPTRYLVNDACVILGIPNAYGSIFRFEGQASVFGAEDGPCYRCLYPEPPPPGLVPSCAEGGVLGHPARRGRHHPGDRDRQADHGGRRAARRPLPGLRRAADALPRAEAAQGSGLPGLRRQPHRHRAHRLRAVLRRHAGGAGSRPAGGAGDEATVEQLKARIDSGDGVFILDVREPQEYQICSIPGSMLIPLGDLPGRLAELDGRGEMIVHCKSGVRSAKAVKLLREAGFAQARNLKGGILRWIDAVDPSLPKY